MSFPNDVTIATPSPSRTYSLISMVGARAIRKDATRPLETPFTMTISHETTGKGAAAVDRHLVRFDQVELDSGDNVTLATGSVHLVLTVPRRVITAQVMQDLVVRLTTFVSSGNVTKLLAGEP